MFSKILVANRGEIAVRIIRACKEMGVATVAVYSEADKNALHVALADQSYCIGGPEASESYLNENQIISTAILVGAQAIHPGDGFLSENAHFARLCRKNGIVFIGPDPESMERLSDKAILKELISKTGLSVIPGTKAVSSVEEAKKEAEKIGYPVMLKACAGGGGRGIRLIRTEADLDDAYHQATSEALSAFGDGSVYLEKYIFPARHVELQILADEHGNAVCLGDRDCSLQRRNQKLLEETPSPAV
ncbi:MAG: ATP-grasp domain-containing protein, partial [Clostridia bacterium]|nr:ATP-grasp domain-containing protein [Clostridia bacterium]